MRDTIDMAREAGDDWDSTLSTDKEFLKRFEALVRADERDRAMRENAYVQAEREACAKVCDEEYFAYVAADAIRARGNT